jgi:hypothetical protein
MQCMDQATIFSKTLASNTSFCSHYQQDNRSELCIQMHCTIRELLSSFYTLLHGGDLMSLAIKNITEATCGLPQRNRTKAVSITGVVGISLAMLAFLLRLLARTINHQFGMDDWTMIIAMVPAINARSYHGLQVIGLRDPAFYVGCGPYVKPSSPKLGVGQ